MASSKCARSLILCQKSNEEEVFDDQGKWEKWLTEHKVSKAVFIVHGYNSGARSEWIRHMKDAIFDKDRSTDIIVCLVDWENEASGGIFRIAYPPAVGKMPDVGKWLGQYVRSVRNIFPRAYIHGIGHSLGAHLLGNAARNSEYPFNRISGLDPAGPSLERKNPGKMLCAGDVLSGHNNGIVDIIHTDGWYDGFGSIGPNHYGTLLPLGTVDFYPNHGISLQPGTDMTPISGIGKSHNRAHELFTWSISNPRGFTTTSMLDGTPEYQKPVKQTKTGPQTEMGYYVDSGACGNYYIKTNGKAPWVPTV